MRTSSTGTGHFLAAALTAASLKIFFTVASLKVNWLLPEPMKPELGTLVNFGGTFVLVSCFAIIGPLKSQAYECGRKILLQAGFDWRRQCRKQVTLLIGAIERDGKTFEGNVIPIVILGFGFDLQSFPWAGHPCLRFCRHLGTLLRRHATHSAN